MVSRPRHGLSLCAGGGGLDLGLMLAEPGFHTRAFVEWEAYPRTVLVAAQRAGVEAGLSEHDAQIKASAACAEGQSVPGT